MACGGTGPEIVRVEHVQQRLGDFGELIVELAMHSTGQEREGFDQTLDVGILAGIRLQQQPAGHLGILFREFPGHLADELQLAFVVGQQFVDHAFPPDTATRRDSRCRETPNTTDSAAEPTRSNASI